MAAADKKKRDPREDPEENEDDNEGQEPAEKNGSKLKLIIIIAVVVILLAGGGAAAYFFFIKAKPDPTAQAPAAATQKPKVAVFYPMDPYIVNLIDETTERYLKVVMQLELSDPMAADEMKRLDPKLRDTILDLLSSKTFKEMVDPLAKQRLRDEIAMRMNMNIDLAKGKVLNVYFTEFIIQ